MKIKLVNTTSVRYEKEYDVYLEMILNMIFVQDFTVIISPYLSSFARTFSLSPQRSDHSKFEISTQEEIDIVLGSKSPKFTLSKMSENRVVRASKAIMK